jgi:hypothetical protein
MYHAGKVGLNYLIDRDIEMNNLILMDYYARTSPQRWKGVKSLVKFTGEYAYFVQDLPRLAAMRLVGKDRSIVYVGRGQSLKMIKPLFFREDVSVEDLGRVPIWSLPKLSEQWSREEVGLIIQETSRAHQGQLKGRVNFRVPSWIQQIVALPETLESIVDLPGIERDLRRVVKRMNAANTTYSFSTSEEEFRHFYDQLYLPFIVSRHGEYAMVTPYDSMDFIRLQDRFLTLYRLLRPSVK